MNNETVTRGIFYCRDSAKMKVVARFKLHRGLTVKCSVISNKTYRYPLAVIYKIINGNRVQSIATVRDSRTEPIDDDWETIIAEIELSAIFRKETLTTSSDFSHLEIIYYLDKVENQDVIFQGDHVAIQIIHQWAFSHNVKRQT